MKLAQILIEAGVTPDDLHVPYKADDWQLQFLSDVVTAAGLLRHGKTSKKLADRISGDSYKWMHLLFENNMEVKMKLSEVLTKQGISPKSAGYTYKYIAQDKNGRVFTYSKKPSLSATSNSFEGTAS